MIPHLSATRLVLNMGGKTLVDGNVTSRFFQETCLKDLL